MKTRLCTDEGLLIKAFIYFIPSEGLFSFYKFILLIIIDLIIRMISVCNGHCIHPSCMFKTL